MEKKHRDILAQLRQNIVDDLDVYNVLNPLATEYVLRKEDVDAIKSGRTKEDRAKILLDILPRCGPNAFDAFNRALKHLYSWLSGDLERLSENIRHDVSDVGRISPGSPNLPPQPEMSVNREAKMSQLKSGLEKLEPGGYLALHGMKGFGKSCLTATTLKDTALVKSAFHNKVYWIKFGNERLIENEILMQLNFMYHQIRKPEDLSSIFNSEPLKVHLVHYLRSHFSKENNRNALLILDDVWSKEIIDVFDFHCKTLVITTDIDILDGKPRDIIEMKDGFTEAESLGLFAQVLEMEVEDLPPEAKKIHDECNGMPILIAMFAAQFEEFKEDMKINPGRWKYYLDSLRNKDPTNKVIGKFLTKQEAIFDMCIERLPADAKTKYEALAIFSQDVNIMPQTLEILWEEDPFKVEDHMLDLCHKSLAAKHWNDDLKSYVYGVHDLLLCHVRRKMTAEKLQDLHRSFIDKYRKYCKDDFSKLPDDNYSFSYIGHHLEQSGLYSKFPKLYMNFDFIREKINRTGLSDLLIDLKKYRNLIIGTADDGEANVQDLEKFLENLAAIIAEHRRRDCLDIVQIGLNYSIKGFIREKAVELATKQPEKLYVTYDHSPIVHYSSMRSEEVCTEGRTACFTNDENRILIGNYSGEVILWDCETRKQTVFSGHRKQNAIEKITVARSGNFFVTLCRDGHVKLFQLREEEKNGSESGEPGTPLQSPREKQSFWSGIFCDRSSNDNSHATFFIDGETITDVALSQDDKRIGVCTNSGIIQVWNMNGEILYNSKAKDHNFERIAFTRDGAMLHVLDSDGVLKFYGEQIGSSVFFSYLSTYNPNLRNQKVILLEALPKTDRSLIIVTEVSTVYLKWIEAYDPNSPGWVGQVHSFKKLRAPIEDSDTRYTCAALTHDGQYLIIGNSKGFINVWDISIGISVQPVATFKGRVNSLDTYWRDEGYHLICGIGRKVIHRWTLALENLPQSPRKPLFDAVMTPWGEVDIVAKETPENKIVLSHGEKIIAITEPVDGTIVRLSLNSDGDKIVYATDKGQVTLFDQATKKSVKIMKVAPTPSFLTFVKINDSTIVVCGDGDTLRIGRDPRSVSTAENTGNVIAVHTVGKNFVATVARNGNIIFWRANGTEWIQPKMLKSCAKNESLCYSCLSPNGRSLTVLKTNYEMIVYDIIIDISVEPDQIDTDILAKHQYDQKLSCCEYTQDDNYLAIGLESGKISIFDITGRCEVTCLELHCNEVRQLHWSRNSIGSPILLSVNCDELAWWDVSPLLRQQKRKRRSRIGLSQSTSGIGISPRSSARLAASQSLQSEMFSTANEELQNLVLQSITGNSSDQSISNGNGHAVSNIAEAYWKNKTPKHPDKLALLSVVPLPPSCNSKICVSRDFSKALSVDSHGSVSNFKLFNYK